MLTSLVALLALAAAAGALFGPPPGVRTLRRLSAFTAIVLVLGAAVVAVLAFAPLPSGLWHTLLVVAMVLAILASMVVPFVSVHWWRRRPRPM
jgi:putative flippase GtrA